MFSKDTTREAGPFSGFGTSSGEMKLPTTSIPSPMTSGWGSALGGSYNGQMPNFSSPMMPRNWMGAEREPAGLVPEHAPASETGVAAGNQMPLPPQSAPAQQSMQSLPQMPLPMPSRFMSQLPPEMQNLFGPLTTALQSHPVMRLLSMLLRRPGGGTGGLRDLFQPK